MITLKELSSGDNIGTYLEWMNDPDVTRFTESHGRHTEEELNAYIKKINGLANVHLFGIYLEDEHIGNVKFGPTGGGSGSVGLIIGKKWWGNGHGAETVNLISDIAFNGLGQKRITCGCYASNVSAINTFMRCGFKYVGWAKGKREMALKFIKDKK